MQDTIRGDARVIEDISPFCTESDAIHHSIDSYGNAFHWFRLDTPRHLPQAAAALHKAEHIDELVADGKTHVRVDYKVSGIGSHSCGPELLPQYRLSERHIDYRLCISPIL